MSKWKGTKDQLLEPRPCPRCERWMDREFLEERHRDKCRRVRKSLRGRPGPKSKVELDKLKEMIDKEACTMEDLCIIFGVGQRTIQRKIKELKEQDK